jgi:hypothetical protein
MSGQEGVAGREPRGPTSRVGFHRYTYPPTADANVRDPVGRFGVTHVLVSDGLRLRAEGAIAHGRRRSSTPILRP